MDGMYKTKTIEIEGRKYSIRKFDAKSALKISKLIIAKVLPVFDTVLPAIVKSNDWRRISLDEALDLQGIARALDLIDDKDMDKIIDVSLQHTFEELPAGLVPVMNMDGSYGVGGIEDDPVIVLRLTVEAVAWSAQGFFDVSRLTSILQPLTSLLTPER